MKEIRIRHKNIDLVWCGGLILRKDGSFAPMRLSYNGAAGWWVTRKDFFSTHQLKRKLTSPTPSPTPNGKVLVRLTYLKI